MALSDKIMRKITAKGTTKAIYGMNDVDYAKQGKALFIGDSYLQGYTPTGTVKNWGQFLAENLGIADSDYKEYSTGGTGFATAVNGTTFGTMANTAATELTDKEDYTLIVVGGGYNDGSGTDYYSVRTGMIETYTTLHTNFPNAEIIYAFLGWGYRKSTSSSTGATAWGNYYRYRNWAQAWAAIHRDSSNTSDGGIDVKMYLDAYISLAHAMGGYMTSDGVHPSVTGQQCIADYLYSAMVGLTGGYVPYTEATNNQWYNTHLEIMTYGEWVHLNWFWSAWASETSNVTFTSLADGKAIQNETVYGRITFSNITDTTKLFCGNNASTSSSPVRNAYVSIPVNVYVHTDEGYVLIPSYISFDNDGTILLTAQVGVSTGTGWKSYTSLTDVCIGGGQVTIPIFYL